MFNGISRVQDINFKICVTLFGWKELKLHKQHILQCKAELAKISDLLLRGLSTGPAGRWVGEGEHLWVEAL